MFTKKTQNKHILNFRKKVDIPPPTHPVISVSVASLVSARGWVQNGAEWYYVDNNNDYVTETIQSSGSSKFYLGEDGAMVRDYFLEDDGNGNTYYFGSNGAMVTNTWVAIESSVVDNQGSYVPDNYWYYFQSSGKAMKGSSNSMKKATIDGKKYGFNADGQMAVGWVDEYGNTTDPDADNPFEDATYYCGGDNDGALRSGWVTYYDGYDNQTGNKADYTNLYFYFNPSNNKKMKSETKKVNGRTYAFDANGVMLSGWDVNDEGLIANKTTYFSGEDDGHQVKKGWVYAVPSESVSKSDYDDNEEKYMYFGSDGDITSSDIKKINGKYYVFNDAGIMKTGIVMWCTSNIGTTSKYVDKIDTDYAKGADIAKKGMLQYDSDSEATQYLLIVDKDGIVQSKKYATDITNVDVGDKIKLHYFGDDGARRTGLNTIEFNDDNYVLNTNNSGDKGSIIDKKKYYSLGIALKADADLRYGIYVATAGEMLQYQAGKYADNLASGYYKVLTTSGTLQKGNNSAKKDANGNYWLIRKTNDTLIGIWSENVKMGNNSARAGLTTRSYTYSPTTISNKKDESFEKEDGTVCKSTDVTNSAGGNISYTIANIPTSAVDNFADGLIFADTSYTAGCTWTGHVNTDHTEIYFTLEKQYDGISYQQTLAGKQNVWIPFGMIDDGGNTEVNYAIGEDKLDDSYFLNCYIEYDKVLDEKDS